VYGKHFAGSLGLDLDGGDRLDQAGGFRPHIQVLLLDQCRFRCSGLLFRRRFITTS
jgi:hypothetical protein